MSGVHLPKLGTWQIPPNQSLLNVSTGVKFVDALLYGDICFQGFGRNGLNPSCIQWMWDGGVGVAEVRLGGAAIVDVTGLTPNIRIFQKETRAGVSNPSALQKFARARGLVCQSMLRAGENL
jgi:hypothetical protein